jgi:tetrapyrrole methylase family protein/MazG family protein
MPEHKFDELVALVAKLRSPGGCPWDLEQSFDTLKPMLLEEAYEVLEALDSGHRSEFCAELGDLLFQVIFHARLAEEEGSFNLGDVIQKILTKMIRRHPHVFSDFQASSADEVLINWERIKQDELKEKGDATPNSSILKNLPHMPALLKAHKISCKVARVGFDWSNIDDVLLKLHEEIDELKDALKNERNQDATNLPAVEQEIGDLLFVVVNIARFLKLDPETALRKTNEKFVKRFQYIEESLRHSGKDIHASNLEEMERLWQEAKKKVE